MSETAPRPRSVTLACVYGGLGGVLTTVVLAQTLSGWGSLEMQETLRSSLEQVGASVDLDTILPVLRWAVLAMLVGAIAAAVFAVYAARGHQASRIGLSVLAGLAAITFTFAGVSGLVPAVFAAIVLYLLWNRPARHWYAVVNGRTPLSLGAAPSVAAPPALGPTQVSPTPAGPTPTGPQPPPYDPAQHAGIAAGPVAGPRPRPVRIALAVAGLGSLIGAGLSGLFLLAVLLLRDQIVAQYAESDLLRKELDSAGMSAEQLVTLGTGIFAAWFVVSVCGIVATVWAASGRRSGWWALVVVSVLTAGVAALGLPIGAVWIVGAIIVVAQLARVESKAWFRRA